ncbi:hypothetical protein [Streptomyces sp. CC0208]|uniref:hypothetical protein n=1 Tax=Streptomyces sp. CC0208 TaxID=2306165 RepID=UPI0006801FBA|nr:hypothetical protein [Streptomyces sp. CC0208]
MNDSLNCPRVASIRFRSGASSPHVFSLPTRAGVEPSAGSAISRHSCSISPLMSAATQPATAFSAEDRSTPEVGDEAASAGSLGSSTGEPLADCSWPSPGSVSSEQPERPTIVAPTTPAIAPTRLVL